MSAAAPASPDGAIPGALADRLARAITLAGPMPLSQFMAAANTHYYATRDPLGVDGDFTTAPEISQMFGELIGAWITDLWERAGQPAAHYVELGPGRGTLAADALRAMASAGLSPPVHFVETSPALRKAQAVCVPGAAWHDTVATLPPDRPLLVVANEFFDALPIEQLVRDHNGWRRRLVACQDTLFLPIAGPVVPDTVIPAPLRESARGSVLETSPAAVGVVRALAARLRAQGGVLLIVDYGHQGPRTGETLQAVKAHRFANPFEAPGSVDLSAHVDFTTLAAAGQIEGCAAHGPVAQRDFLGQLGLAQRAAALVRRAPDRADEVAGAHLRLTSPEQMGTLFKVLAVVAPDWPEPAGFA